VVASKAAFIFSLTIKFASRWALLPPRISFIIRSAITAFASAANNIKGLNIRCAPRVTRRMVRNCSGSARHLDRQTERDTGGRSLITFAATSQNRRPPKVEAVFVGLVAVGTSCGFWCF
jgi:hypothetical protein